MAAVPGVMTPGTAASAPREAPPQGPRVPPAPAGPDAYTEGPAARFDTQDRGKSRRETGLRS
jgi:hypothetical protein